MNTLYAAWSGRHDQFDRLRLFAAALVIYGHSYALASPGHGDVDLLLRMTGAGHSGEIAVWMFFVISGFLLTMSWQGQPDLQRYLRNRVLRILPAYAVCLLLTALVLGPLVTSRAFVDYLTDPATWRYIVGNLSYLDMQYRLPGVFETLPYAGIVNGSIWSLQAEVWAYALLLLAGLLGLLKPGRYAFAVLLGTALTWALASQLTRLAPEIPPALGAFALGALAAVHARRIPLHGALPLAVLGCFVVAGYLDADLAIRRGLLLLAIAMLTLWLAYRLTQRSGHADPSYGLYLYGFPVQQLCVSLFPSLTPLGLTALALPIAWLLGHLSWRYIEAPALRFKRAGAPSPTRLRDAPSPASDQKTSQ